MNKYNLKWGLFFLMVELFDSCSKEQDASINLIKRNGEKIIFTSGIYIKNVKKTERGVVIFYDTIKKATYSDAMILIPKDKKDIEVIYKSLFSKKVSFESNLFSVTLNAPEKLFLVIDNEKGQEIMKKYKRNNLIKMMQIGHFRGQKFDGQKIENQQNKTSIKELLYLERDAGDVGSGGCTSGGIGATSCSVRDIWSSCSVSCSAGYYACCKGKGGSTTCDCIPNPK